MENAVVGDLDTEGLLTHCESTCSNIEGYNKMNLKSRITTVFQFGKLASNEAMVNEIARLHYQNGFNSTDIEIFNTQTWPYFYKWDPVEVSKGNHWKVFEMQGEHRTWYAGASVCFESVKSVMEYNNLLLKQLGNLQHSNSNASRLDLRHLFHLFLHILNSNNTFEYFYRF